MKPFTYPFDFRDGNSVTLAGNLFLDDISQLSDLPLDAYCYRTGRVILREGNKVEIVLVHSPATESFIYLYKARPNTQFFQLVGLPSQGDFNTETLLPGQLILGAERTQVVGNGVRDIFRTSIISEIFRNHHQNQMVVLPVLREGSKYQATDAILSIYGYYCDEIVVDAHHMLDETVDGYNRRVSTVLFNDKDLTKEYRENVKIGFISDSIASGIVLLGVIGKIQEQFKNLKQVEVIAPFTTLRGLARIAAYTPPEFTIRVHIFETVLNALPPDYFYSAHFTEPRLHNSPDAEKKYQAWWGKDDNNNSIADTACAGYGWSEAFFVPRKHFEMMNQQLEARHQLTIADIISRNL